MTYSDFLRQTKGMKEFSIKVGYYVLHVGKSAKDFGYFVESGRSIYGIDSFKESKKELWDSLTEKGRLYLCRPNMYNVKY